MTSCLFYIITISKLKHYFCNNINISPNKHVTAYLCGCMLLNVMHHTTYCVAAYLQSLCCTHKLKHFKVLTHFEKPESSLSQDTKSIFCRCSTFILGFLFIGSFVLICLDLNTISFFYSPLPLFIANSNGANVICHSLDPLWAVHTTGTFLSVSRTPRR